MIVRSGEEKGKGRQNERSITLYDRKYVVKHRAI